MAALVRFYFDFNSSFSYIVARKIDDLTARHGRAVDWIAISLAHIFRDQGITPSPSILAKITDLATDFSRSCALAGLPAKPPHGFRLRSN